MEVLYRDDLHAHVGGLPHHFYKGWEWHKAFGYLLEAVAQARHSHACQEALTCIERALEILSKTTLTAKHNIAMQLFKWKGSMHYGLEQMAVAANTISLLFYG